MPRKVVIIGRLCMISPVMGDLQPWNTLLVCFHLSIKLYFVSVRSLLQQYV